MVSWSYKIFTCLVQVTFIIIRHVVAMLRLKLNVKKFLQQTDLLFYKYFLFVTYILIKTKNS